MKLLSFGIMKEIVGHQTIELSKQFNTVGEFRAYLNVTYPEIQKLKSLMIAVNESYSEEDQVLNDGDEIALIPPVSGG